MNVSFISRKSTLCLLGCVIFIIVVFGGLYSGFLFEYMISDQIINYVESQAHSDYNVLLLNQVVQPGNTLQILNETMHFKLLIGAGPPKSGTTYIKHCIEMHHSC